MWKLYIQKYYQSTQLHKKIGETNKILTKIIHKQRSTKRIQYSRFGNYTE